jgi:hypothetical protein
LSKSVPKISVVVVSYNMARELPRTIRSLSPIMQRGIDPADVEVILIDNGSTEPFDETELRRIMPTLIVRRFADATPSPVPLSISVLDWLAPIWLACALTARE